MGSTIRPGPRGLNARFLEMEAPIRKLLMDLFSGEPSGYNDDYPTMPQGPDAPMTDFDITGIKAAPQFQPDSGYGAPSRGAFGLDKFAPLLAAAMTGRIPGEEPPDRPMPRPTPREINPSTVGPRAIPRQRDRGIGHLPIDTRNIPLPEVHDPAMAAVTGGLTPEVLALSENLANTPRSVSNTPAAPRMASRPPNLPLGRRPSSPALSARTTPLEEPISEPRVIEPFDMEDSPEDLSPLLNRNNALANAIPEVNIPEPYDGPMDDLEPEGPRMAAEDILGEDLFETPATDDYLNTLRNRPRHEDHEGSRARRTISGIFKGLFGADWGVGDAVHQKALRKFNDENFGKKEASVIEQSGLKENRLRLKDVMVQQQAKQNYELKVQQELNRYKQFEANLGYKMDKAERDRLVQIEKNATLARIAEWRKEYQTQRLGIDRERVGLERERVGISRDRANKAGDRPLDPRVQEGIEKEARRIVRNDPRFSEWYIPESDEFNSIPARRSDGRIKRDKQGNVVMQKEMDPATKQMITEALVKARELVANRKRSSYSRRGFPSPFDDADEMDLDDMDLFDEH